MSQSSRDNSLDQTGNGTSDPSPPSPVGAARSRLAEMAVTGAILLATFAVGLAAVPVRSLWQARAAGQFVTGAAVGTTFTPAILVTILGLLPAMMAAVVISLGISAAGALILMRLGNLDARTAALATMPGGVIEMANVAQRVNADHMPILVLQTMRVGLTVCAAPFLVSWLAEAGARNVVLDGATMSWLVVLGLMAVSFVGGWFLNRFALPNSWFLGSLLTMAALGAFGLISGRVPEPILVVAQVVIGVSIGTQYKHEFLTRLLRLFLSSLVTVPFALIMTALVAAAFSAVLGLPVTTLVLALAPAGIAEMALTGKVLGLDAALITAFQIVRIVLVITFAAWTCRLFERLVARFG